MKRALLLLVLVLYAASASAWETSVRAASCDVVTGATVTKPYVPDAAMTVASCPITGCILMCHLVMPKIATSAQLGLTFRRFSPDSSIVPATPFLETFGAFVVAPATATPIDQAQNAGNFAYLPQSSTQVPAQWDLMTKDYQPTGGSAILLTPTFWHSGVVSPCGSVLSPTECSGGELYIAISLDSTPNVIDYTSITVQGR